MMAGDLFQDVPGEGGSDADDSDAPDFDWSDKTNVCVNEQPETACYYNLRGQVVIRQRAACGRCEEDSFVFFEPDRALLVLEAIRDLIDGRPIGGGE